MKNSSDPIGEFKVVRSLYRDTV